MVKASKAQQQRIQPRDLFHHRLSINGFSLIELMIASAIGIFLMTAIIQVFSQSQQTVTLNQTINELQDKGRSLMHHLAGQLQQRGFQGCLPPLAIDITQVDNIDWDNIQTITPLSNDLPEVPFTRTAFQAFDVDENNTWSPPPPGNPITALANGVNDRTPRAGSDVIYIQYADAEGANLPLTMSSEMDTVPIPTGSLDLEVGDTVFIGDCSNADIFTITNITVNGATTELAHEISANRSPQLTKAYDVNAQVRRFHAASYFVADTERDTQTGQNIYALYRLDINDNLVELSDGVDFLQATYTQLTADGAQEITASHPDFDPLKIIGADIGVLVVGMKNVLFEDDDKSYRLPGALIGPAQDIRYEDSRFLKNVFSTYVDLKNRS